MKLKRPPGLLALTALATLLALGYGTYRVFAIGNGNLNFVLVLTLAIAFSRGVWIAQNSGVTWLRERGELAIFLSAYLAVSALTIHFFSASIYVFGVLGAVSTIFLLAITIASLYEVIIYPLQHSRQPSSH